MKSSIIVLDSVTYAVKGRKLLGKNGIRAKLVKVDSFGVYKGCRHGLEINNSEFYSAVMVLRTEGINYEVYRDT